MTAAILTIAVITYLLGLATGLNLASAHRVVDQAPVALDFEKAVNDARKMGRKS